MSKTITKQQLLQLHGLRVLADRHAQMMESLAESVREITGEDADMGHSYDFVFDEALSPEELLKRLGIEVSETGQ
jgi:hypothetical protein